MILLPWLITRCLWLLIKLEDGYSSSKAKVCLCFISPAAANRSASILKASLGVAVHSSLKLSERNNLKKNSANITLEVLGADFVELLIPQASRFQLLTLII